MLRRLALTMPACTGSGGLFRPRGAPRFSSSSSPQPASIIAKPLSTSRGHPLFNGPTRSIGFSATFLDDASTLHGICRTLKALDANLEAGRGFSMGSQFSFTISLVVPESVTADQVKAEVENKFPNVSAMAFDNRPCLNFFEPSMKLLSLEAVGIAQHGLNSAFAKLVTSHASSVRTFDSHLAQNTQEPFASASMSALIVISPEADLAGLERDLHSFENDFFFDVTAQDPEEIMSSQNGAMGEENDGDEQSQSEDTPLADSVAADRFKASQKKTPPGTGRSTKA